MSVFLDTVGLLALWDRSDQWHGAAESAFAILAARREELVTSTLILFECGNAASRRPYRQAVDLLRRELQTAGRLIVPTEGEIEEAWDAYARGHSGGPGIVDNISFVLMRRLGIQQAFTNDRHFLAEGFQVLF
jgi:predicted nucleic acid-binding protein